VSSPTRRVTGTTGKWNQKQEDRGVPRLQRIRDLKEECEGTEDKCFTLDSFSRSCVSFPQQQKVIIT
jgi:hypothetical protein